MVKVNHNMNHIIKYLKNHWQGNLNLCQSFWINVVLINCVIFYASNQLYTYFESWNNKLIVYQYITISLPCWSIVYVWQLIGCWRSMITLKQKSEWSSFSIVAIQTLLLGSLLFVIPGGFSYLEFAKIATGTDGISEYSIELDGSVLTINGYFGFGLEDDIEKILSKNENIYLIVLNSAGGRTGVARDVAYLIHKYQLSTYSTDGCYSACVTPFMSGTNRMLREGAKIGFHAATFPGLSKRELYDLEASERNFYKYKGLPNSFIEKASKVPPDDMWYPTIEELAGNNVITHIEKDGKIISVTNN